MSALKTEVIIFPARTKTNPPIYYHEFVEKLIKKFPDNPKLELAHSAMGISGEAGELCDAIKKCVIYGKTLDRANVVEELGDLKFFMQDIMNKLDISWDEVVAANIDKLMERYQGMQYSDEAAITRADKQVVKYVIAESEEHANSGLQVAGPYDTIAEAQRSEAHRAPTDIYPVVINTL